MLECLPAPEANLEIRCEGVLGCWREPPYAYYFFRQGAAEKALVFLEALGFHVTGRYEMTYEQWQRLPSRTLDVGPFRVVYGPSEDRWPQKDLQVIFLNPGLVFGSGLHPTTQLCLRLLGQVFCPAAMRTVVDLGTGTGVLALAAAQLGACRVVAVDVNPLAVQEAAANVSKNRLQGRIFPLAAEGLSAVGRFGRLLIMNLEWPSLQAVLQTDAWRRFSYVLCSGYLHANAQEVFDRLCHSHGHRANGELEGWGASFWGRRD